MPGSFRTTLSLQESLEFSRSQRILIVLPSGLLIVCPTAFRLRLSVLFCSLIRRPLEKPFKKASQSPSPPGLRVLTGNALGLRLSPGPSALPEPLRAEPYSGRITRYSVH